MGVLAAAVACPLTETWSAPVVDPRRTGSPRQQPSLPVPSPASRRSSRPMSSPPPRWRTNAAYNRQRASADDHSDAPPSTPDEMSVVTAHAIPPARRSAAAASAGLSRPAVAHGTPATGRRRDVCRPRRRCDAVIVADADRLLGRNQFRGLVLSDPDPGSAYCPLWSDDCDRCDAPNAQSATVRYPRG